VHLHTNHAASAGDHNLPFDTLEFSDGSYGFGVVELNASQDEVPLDDYRLRREKPCSTAWI
jgi:hypothetical protein